MSTEIKFLVQINGVLERINQVQNKIELLLNSISVDETSGILRARANRYFSSKLALDMPGLGADIKAFFSQANIVVRNALALASAARRVKSLTIEQKNRMSDLRAECRALIADIEVFLEIKPLGNEGSQANKEMKSLFDDAKVKIGALIEEHERHDSRHQKLLSENSKKINDLELKLATLSTKVGEELFKTKDLYGAAIEEIEGKREEVNGLLGIVSGVAVAGSFEKSAQSEGEVADTMRWISIGCMAVVVIIISISLWFTLSKEFDWRFSLFSLAFAIFLSVPSAYLARESAKHRNQHNKYLQLALELKAINPYIASLPIEDQHKIKSEMAGRMFCVDREKESSIDSYPVNVQEIIMEIIKRVELKGKA